MHKLPTRIWHPPLATRPLTKNYSVPAPNLSQEGERGPHFGRHQKQALPNPLAWTPSPQLDTTHVRPTYSEVASTLSLKRHSDAKMERRILNTRCQLQQGSSKRSMCPKKNVITQLRRSPTDGADGSKCSSGTRLSYVDSNWADSMEESPRK